VEAALGAMQLFPTAAAVAAAACALLRRAARAPAAAARLVRRGGLRALVAQAGRHPRSVEVSAGVASVLAQLPGTSVAGDAVVVALLGALLRCHGEDAAVLRFACAALRRAAAADARAVAVALGADAAAALAAPRRGVEDDRSVVGAVAQVAREAGDGGLVVFSS
jgi:hypothetical protein